MKFCTLNSGILNINFQNQNGKKVNTGIIHSEYWNFTLLILEFSTLNTEFSTINSWTFHWMPHSTDPVHLEQDTWLPVLVPVVVGFCALSSQFWILKPTTQIHTWIDWLESIWHPFLPNWLYQKYPRIQNGFYELRVYTSYTTMRMVYLQDSVALFMMFTLSST